MIRVAENRIVEEIGQSRYRPVKSALPSRPPVAVLKNQTKVFGGRLMNLLVVEDQGLIVEYKARPEGIRIRGNGDQTQPCICRPKSPIRIHEIHWLALSSKITRRL